MKWINKTNFHEHSHNFQNHGDNFIPHRTFNLRPVSRGLLLIKTSIILKNKIESNIVIILILILISIKNNYNHHNKTGTTNTV